MTHAAWFLFVLAGLVSGVLGGILLDQRYISKPAPEVITLTVKEPPKPVQLTADCGAAVKLCRQTFKDRLRTARDPL